MWLESYPEGSYADAQGEGGGPLEESVVDSGEHTHVWEVLSENKGNLGKIWTWKYISLWQNFYQKLQYKIPPWHNSADQCPIQKFYWSCNIATESCQMLVVFVLILMT